VACAITGLLIPLTYSSVLSQITKKKLLQLFIYPFGDRFLWEAYNLLAFLHIQIVTILHTPTSLDSLKLKINWFSHEHTMIFIKKPGASKCVISCRLGASIKSKIFLELYPGPL
jgi:hypothetical protein